VDILCPSCGVENWLENQSRCLQCQAILRRCVDCGNYDRGKRFCRALDTEIGPQEAASPTLLSTSTNCQTYRSLGRAA